jgi:general secretion pathway protein N
MTRRRLDASRRANPDRPAVTGHPIRLVVAALVLWASPVSGDETTGPPPVKPATMARGAVVANPVSAVPLDHLSATRGRPLFSPGRRPPEPPPTVHAEREPVPRPPPAPPNLTLIGVVLDTEDAHAVVRSGTAVVHARMGDEIDGWKITSIEARRLLLSNQDRSVAFALFADKQTAAAPPATAAPVPAGRAPKSPRAPRPGPQMQ